MYLYRAVDSRGQTVDFLLSAKRDAETAKRFFRKALAQPHTVNPRTHHALDPTSTCNTASVTFHGPSGVCKVVTRNRRRPAAVNNVP